jgi:hypothetical protein
LKKEKYKRDAAFYHGAGHQAMKNNPSDWVTPILERTEKYKDERGVELCLENSQDGFGKLLKDVAVEAIKLMDKQDYFGSKLFLMKNFDLKKRRKNEIIRSSTRSRYDGSTKITTGAIRHCSSLKGV